MARRNRMFTVVAALFGAELCSSLLAPGRTVAGSPGAGRLPQAPPADTAPTFADIGPIFQANCI